MAHLPGPDECELCRAERVTEWFHEDELCWVAECESCSTPMVVWKVHDPSPPADLREQMLARLAEATGQARWIAEALELPGVLTYGETREEAISNTERLAIEVIADRIKHGELPPSSLNVSFLVLSEQLAGD